MVKLVVSMHEISGSNPDVMYIFKNVLYWYILVYASIYASEMSCTSINLFVVVCTCLCLDRCVVLQYILLFKVYQYILIWQLLFKVYTSIY